MSRRHVIAAFAAGSLSLAGCLGTVSTGNRDDSTPTTGSSSTATRSETLREGVVPFKNLSTEAQTEVKRAIQHDGIYSKCGPLALRRELDFEQGQLIRYQDTLYEPAVIVGGAGKDTDTCDEHSLQLERVNTSATSS